MAFTSGELASIANSALDFYVTNPEYYKQSIENKPLLDKMFSNKKTFSGGKGDISLGIIGDYGAGGTNDTMTGFTHDDTVAFYTPANNERVNYPWREVHLGLTLTYTELKMNGTPITEDEKGTKSLSGRDKHALINLVESKMHDFDEQAKRSLNDMIWGDGTADAKGFAGVQSMIVANPTTGSVGGINGATTTWWRNRAYTAAHQAAGGEDEVTSSTSGGGALINVLNKEHRQLTRFGGKPDLFLAGSDFIDALEREYRANGYYSQSGFSNGGEVGVGGLRVKGTLVQYDPWLDNNSLSKRGYWIDTSAVCYYTMAGEHMRKFTPSRPETKFALYKSLTLTGNMVCTRRNSSLVIDIA